MDITLDVLKQDIAAAMESLSKQEFNFVRIMGNRLMANSLIGNRRDLMIVGFLMREVAGEFELIKHKDESRIPGCKGVGEKFLKLLDSLVTEETIDAGAVWTGFREHEDRIRPSLLSVVESSVYKENPEFTAMAATVLSQHLKDNMDLLSTENNQLTTGILNELSRLINVHGAGEHTLMFYILMRALDEYYKYLRYSMIVGEFIQDKERLKSELFPRVNEILTLHSSPLSPGTASKAIEIIGNLGVEWRKYFINYFELQAQGELVVGRRNPPVRLPEDAKKKIEETIVEAMEKEVKKT